VEDNLYDDVCAILTKRGSESVVELLKSLLDKDTDFVIQRRIPKILAMVPSVDAEEGLLEALHSPPFEIRYRAAIALMKRRQSGYPRLPEDEEQKIVWRAIRFEIKQERPVVEAQNILDTLEESERDDFPRQQLQVREQFSLEHVFRMLALIFDSKLISAAYQGLAMEKTKLKGFSLEYLEHILPQDVREKLWLLIGNISEYRNHDSVRPLEEVAAELLKTGATLLPDKNTKRDF